MNKSLIALITVFIFTVFTVAPSWALAETIHLEGGTVDVNVLDSVTNVGVTGNPIWNLPEFNIAQGSTYNLTGLSAGASLAMLVNGGQASNIFGTLNLRDLAFILQNIAGIHIGSTGLINLNNASFIASTIPMNLSMTNFLAQQYQFSALPAGRQGQGGFLSNEGRILGGKGDLVALVANAIENKGTIEVPMGTVALAAGKTVTIGLSGDGLISVGVDEATANAMGLKDQIKNTGTIQANGGRVVLDAKAVDGLFEKAIHIQRSDKAVSAIQADNGTIEFKSIDDIYNDAIVQAMQGEIKITSEAGGITNIGSMDASKGRIEIRTERNIENSGAIKADIFREHGYTFRTTGYLGARNGYFDNIDLAADIGGSIGEGTYNDVNFNVTSDLTLLGDVTWNASGAFTMASARSLAGGGHNLTITAVNASTLGSIDDVGTLTLGGSATFTASPTATAWTHITDFRLTDTAKLDRFTGSGTGGSPYLIYDVYGLQAMNGFLSSSFKLNGNITATSTSGWNAGAGFVPVGSGDDNAFTGTFDGDSKIINRLFISRNSEDNIGLFGTVIFATIKNIGLTAVSVTGRSSVGGLIGYVKDETDGSSNTIANTYVTGTVTGSGNHIGGLVGFSYGSSIDNSYSTATVIGANNVGGLVGFSSTLSSITNSYATGNVTGGNNVGGLVGYNFWISQITNSYATGVVTGGGNNVGGLVGLNSDYSNIANSYHATGAVNGSGDRVGGLVGHNSNADIDRSYSEGDVTGRDQVGGLVGFSNSYSEIDNSYASGNVSGVNSVGGLVGRNGDDLSEHYSTYSYIDNSYVTGDVTGSGDGVGGLVGYNTSRIRTSYAAVDVNGSATNKGGLVGVNQGTYAGNYWDYEAAGLAQTQDTGAGDVAGITSRATANMKLKATFSGWDFNGLWKDGAGLAYPTLVWQGMANGNFIGGTFAKPFQISDVQELQFMNYALESYYALANNIDASATSGWNGDAGFDPIGDSSTRFSGGFDGNDHVISNLTINRPSEDNIGLFGYTDQASVSNFGITNSSITGRNNVGGLVGFYSGGLMTSAYSEANVSGANGVGGLLGYNYGGRVVNSYQASGNITATGVVGGVTGFDVGGVYTNVYWDPASNPEITSGIGTLLKGDPEYGETSPNPTGLDPTLLFAQPPKDIQDFRNQTLGMTKEEEAELQDQFAKAKKMQGEAERKAKAADEAKVRAKFRDPMTWNFHPEIAATLITDVIVREGAVVVVPLDGGSETSLLAEGESLSVDYKAKGAELARPQEKESEAKPVQPAPEPPMVTGGNQTEASHGEEPLLGKYKPATPVVAGHEEGAGRYATLKNPGKDVFVQCPGGDWQAAKDGMVIMPGDVVKTAETGSVEVMLDGGKVGRVEIKEGSLFRIRKAETDPTTGDKTTLLELAIGKLIAHVEKLQGKSKFEVKSPTALTGVRGTVFEVTVREKDMGGSNE